MTPLSNPKRTATKDVNYLSLNKDSVVWFAGTDQEVQGEVPYPIELFPTNPKAWDSILKASERSHTDLSGIRISQGKENSIDLNNKCSHLTIDGDIGVTGKEGEQVVTIKGGSWDIVVSGKVYSDGKVADLALGAWSDQSYDVTHHVNLKGLKHITGRPLTVLLVHVDKGSISLPPNCKVLKLKSLLYTIYWWVKRVYVVTVWKWFVAK